MTRKFVLVVTLPINEKALEPLYPYLGRNVKLLTIEKFSDLKSNKLFYWREITRLPALVCLRKTKGTEELWSNHDYVKKMIGRRIGSSKGRWNAGAKTKSRKISYGFKEIEDYLYYNDILEEE